MNSDTLEKVRDLRHLSQLALKKKSIVMIGGGRDWVSHTGRTPAAWVINWSGHMIQQLMPYMFVYKPKEKKSAKSSAEEKISPQEKG
jgi:hypothetical protein